MSDEEFERLCAAVVACFGMAACLLVVAACFVCSVWGKL